MLKAGFAAILLGALFLSTGTAGAGEDASLLPSFGEAGVALSPAAAAARVEGEAALAVAADGRGRLLVAGVTGVEKALLSRFAANGAIDRSFSGNGKVETSLGGAVARAVAPSRGGIVVGGGTETGLALIRYRGNGSSDPSFGHRGHVVIPGGIGGASTLSVDTDPSGRIFAGGYKVGHSHRWTAMVIALRPDGSLRRSFGHGGVVEFPATGGAGAAITGVKVLAGGKVLAAGDLGGRVMLARLLADGRPDPGFGGGDGIVLVDAGVHRPCRCASINGMTVGADGKPVLVGATLRTGEAAGLLVRFDPSGRLDRHFGAAGFVRTERGSRTVFEDATVQANGDITAAGFANVRSGKAELAALRYRPNGRLDRRFAARGVYLYGPGRESIGSAVVTRPDQTVVVAGRASFGPPAAEGSSALDGARVLMLAFRG